MSWGSAAIAGAEESGSLELTLAHGVSRIQYALEAALSIVVRLIALGAYTGMLVALLNEPSELGLDPAHVVAAEAALIGLTLLTASAALAAGAIAGRRVVGTGAGAAVAAVGYVFNAIGNQNRDLEWLHRFSPYDWAFGGSPLREGVDGSGLALLYGCSVLAVLVAVVALQRRDVIG